MRILFALPGLHRVDRGAEIVFTRVGRELSKLGHHVVLAGSGTPRDSEPYTFLHVPSVRRERFERFPLGPVFRDDTRYEELTFAPGLLSRYRPADFDVTATCSFPFTNWVLRRPTLTGSRPPHVFVTQNGDWPARAGNYEYRWFGCEGLICTNPDYFEANKARWRCDLIPNGVETARFKPGQSDPEEFGLPRGRKFVLMVSALIESKRVDVAIDAVSRVPDVHLVVAGDGPMRSAVLAKAEQLLPGRFTCLTLPATRMPDLYRAAHVFLHMSFHESFGNVFLEAMASGLPIVGHDTPRLRWILGDNGDLVDTANLDAVAAAISRSLKEGPEQRDARHEASLAYDWSRIASQYEQFFAQVAGKAGA